MQRQEFDEWFSFHCKLFPQVTEWIADKSILLLLDEWSKALARTRLQDAMKCTRKMISGEVEHPNRFEIATLPAVVCRSCPRQPIPFSQLEGKKYNPSTGEVT